MLRKLRHAFTGLVCFLGSSCTPVSKAPPSTHSGHNERWIAYYDSQVPAEAFKGYDLAVFDRLYHPDLKPLKGHTVLLAYVSFGEVHGDTDDHRLLDAQKALIGNRTKWNSYAVDITAASWKQMLYAQVEDAINQGFDGVMFDTVDSALHMADMESTEKGERAQEAAIALIKGVRQRWPHAKIMMNRGFEILPRVAPALTYALGESTLTDTDISTGQSSVLPPQTYQLMAANLLKARAVAPTLKLYTLDYWNQDDVAGLQTLYAIHRARGFTPYITTPDLRRFTPEPQGKQHAAGVSPVHHLEAQDA
jgi:uncharacterized protein (TIGR01370 family)